MPSRPRCITLLTALLITLAPVGCGYWNSRTREEEAVEAGERAFTDLLGRRGFRYATKPAITQPVARVAQRILDAARTSGYAARAQQVRWDFAVIDAPVIMNAFATPGGRIIVFTGVFPVARTEAGLAAVLGHEVAHVLRQHSIKQSDLVASVHTMATLAGAVAGISAALLTKNSEVAGRVGDAVQTVVAGHSLIHVVLPYSREQEMEADQTGAELAARAGYDPREALAVLERMEAEGGPSSTVALSTHPGMTERRAALQAWSGAALFLFHGNAPGAEDLLPTVQDEAAAAASKRSRKIQEWLRPSQPTGQ